MNKDIINSAKKQATLRPASLLTIVDVETGGEGFDPATGKPIIRFEKTWFRKYQPEADPNGKWNNTKVGTQPGAWIAFNDAFAINPRAAMMATSIGVGQIMGFNYALLGYKTVDDMWNDAKKDLDMQLNQMIRFITANRRLKTAVDNLDWTTVATIYNGAGFRELAKKLKRTPYDISLRQAYMKYEKLL